MGVRERRKEKEKSKSASETSVEEEPVSEAEEVKELEPTHVPEVEIITQSVEVEAESSSEQSSVEESAQVEAPDVLLLPPWGSIEQTEWMYTIPPREEDKEMWAEEWSDFVLIWMEAHEVHVLSVTAFIKEPPFNNIAGKLDSFKIIGGVLVRKEIAEWLDKNKRQLRVYWRFLEDWADIIYDWALKSGKLRLDVKSLVIQEEEHAFARLPEKDLHIILHLMVEKGLAQWIDKKKGAVKILV